MPSSSRYFPSDYHHGGYVAAFYCLSYAARTTQDSPAVWSGWDISLTAIIGIFAFRQQLDVPTSEGIDLSSAGVVVLNLLAHKKAHSGHVPVRPSHFFCAQSWYNPLALCLVLRIDMHNALFFARRDRVRSHGYHCTQLHPPVYAPASIGDHGSGLRCLLLPAQHGAAHSADRHCLRPVVWHWHCPYHLDWCLCL